MFADRLGVVGFRRIQRLERWRDEIRRLIKGERIVRDTGPAGPAPEEPRPGRRSSVPPSGRPTGLEPEPQPGG